jgi:hypothetical protein
MQHPTTGSFQAKVLSKGLPLGAKLRQASFGAHTLVTFFIKYPRLGPQMTPSDKILAINDVL